MRRAVDGNPFESSHHGDKTNKGFFGRHLGYDYVVPVGTPVYAPVSGTIRAIQETVGPGSGGKQIEIAGDDGRWHRFLHLDNNKMFKIGQRFQEGALLAYSGNTGDVTGPHLHHDVRIAGVTWNASFANYFDWEALLKQVSTPTPTPPPVQPGGKWNIGDQIWLKPVPRWRIYARGVAPQAGHEIGYLRPINYFHGPNGAQGLTYRVRELTQFANTVMIDTDTYGRVAIYLDADAVKV